MKRQIIALFKNISLGLFKNLVPNSRFLDLLIQKMCAFLIILFMLSVLGLILGLYCCYILYMFLIEHGYTVMEAHGLVAGGLVLFCLILYIKLRYAHKELKYSEMLILEENGGTPHSPALQVFSAFWEGYNSNKN